MKRYNLVLLSILFILLCVLHGRIGAAEDLIGADVPATADQQAVDAATAKAAATKLPAAVQALVDKADAAVAKIAAKAKDDEGKLRADLVVALSKAQTEATKKGDLALALAIKARIDEQSKLVPAIAEKPKTVEPKPSDALQGALAYAFPNGHSGYIDVTFPAVVDRLSGTRGSLAAEGATFVLTWSNGTKWVIRSRRGELVAEASDGMCTLTRGAQ